jgi:hypothetical protein
VPTAEQWLAERVAALGFEGGDDLALLSPGDFEAPDLPADVRARLDRDYPRSVRLGDATYEAEYDGSARRVALRKVRGARREPPPTALLPRFPGLRVVVDGRTIR